MISSKIIGERVKQYRLHQNLSQEALAGLAGLSRTAVVTAEKGGSGLDTYIAIMKALGRIDAFEAAFPEEAVSPIQMVERNKKKRQRAYNSAKPSESDLDNQVLDW